MTQDDARYFHKQLNSLAKDVGGLKRASESADRQREKLFEQNEEVKTILGDGKCILQAVQQGQKDIGDRLEKVEEKVAKLESAHTRYKGVAWGAGAVMATVVGFVSWIFGKIKDTF